MLRMMWIGALLLAGCAGPPESAETAPPTPSLPAGKLETATLGAGCFWCVEAVFKELKGVGSVTSGYSGGKQAHPSYEEVCTGRTGHAEVIQVQFDPGMLSYRDLLDVFFHVHDPTTLDRQGNDVGTQYRSVVFYHDEGQRKTAEQLKSELAASGEWKEPIVTEIAPFQAFYAADDYHQDYYAANPYQPYCQLVISPKVKKFRKQYSELRKP
ncbi:MAG: peptide-methionine (S)-S-oxide reductase MsrA [Armatimonadetes bacterium]|nr:peptide-methionine (S)-S-oxide reductase MsrA [Armatimonadota bacterium]